MSVFRPSQSYRADLDVRLGNGRMPSWIRPTAEGAAPDGAAWLAVMPRRAGKTWLAQGIAAARPDGGTVRVDLRSPASVRRTRLGCLTEGRPAPPTGPGQLVIVDEPALARPGGPGVDPAVLAAGLHRIRGTGATALVLATPAESALLTPHLGPDILGGLLRPPVLDAEECARMAARAPQWAPALVERVRAADPGWLHTTFLLELLLHTAEVHPALRAAGDGCRALLRAAAEEADAGHEYIRQWFVNGLAGRHRAALRASRWRAAGLPPVTAAGRPAPDAALYVYAAAQDGPGPVPGAPRPGGSLAGDPVLGRHLPEVLRVHHVSDLRHGGRSPVPGAGDALDGYLGHVRRLAARGRAPHLLVVTGGLVERPLDAYGERARAWLAEVAALLAPHRDLRDDDPRVLLVGGSHDVSWDLAPDASPQARHRWFAAAFDGLPHPDLHLADPARRRLYVTYPDAGLRFALLGSTESGAAPAAGRERLRARQERYEAAGTGGAAGAAAVGDFERHDPGVVARGVLDRLAPEPGAVTVAALHHPLSPVPAAGAAPCSGAVNAGEAKRALAAARTSLVLHGRTRLGFAAAERLLGAGPPWTLRIAGAPALGGRGTDGCHGYNELFVAREGGDHVLALRTVRLEGGRWTPGPAHAFRPGAAEEHDLAALCADTGAAGPHAR
ncbi:hypothetical protein [Streptomyces sp. NPDC020983]|uniref:hypothetical protein n=1 Tax=Streptomyces sp. NPDC020983 TaxID=3365106 RepID=UPI00379003A4